MQNFEMEDFLLLLSFKTQFTFLIKASLEAPCNTVQMHFHHFS